MQRPLIFDLARGSFADGPGIRTTVFFKGCPLRCVWCHNPESFSPLPEIVFRQDRCIQCNACREVCPMQANKGTLERRFITDKCRGCGICTENCYQNALKMTGRYYAVEELTEKLMRDKNFYIASGGGVTFSGGEPLSNLRYIEDVCIRLKEKNIHIAVQTCGYFNYELFEKTVQPHIDIIYFDLKILNGNRHKNYTGISNELILQNLNRLQADKRQSIIVRTPLIPLITDAPENLRDIRNYLVKLNTDGYELLDYNPAGKRYQYLHCGK